MITGISVHDRVDWVFTITGMRKLREPQGDLTVAQESADGIVSHDVGKAN
jgi:hypothetical protein